MDVSRFRCWLPFLPLLAGASPLAAQTVVVGPADQYAFQWDNGGGPTALGLFFNATQSRYEFRDMAGAPELSVNPQVGRSLFRGRVGVHLSGSAPLNIFQVEGSARFGNATDYAVFDDDFDLIFSGTADYLVDNNRYAFRSRSNEAYGLFFNAAETRYEFRDAAAQPAFRVGADSGEGWFRGGVRVGASASTEAGTIRFDSTGFQGYDGTAWLPLDGAGTGTDADWTSGSNAFGNLWSNANARFSVGTDDPEGHRFRSAMLLSDHAAVLAEEKSTSFLGTTLYSEARLAWWNDTDPLGLPVDVDNIGVFGRKTTSGNPGAGVYGWTVDDAAENYGGIFAATGNGTTNYALYATATGGGTNWAGYFNGRVRTGLLEAAGDASVAGALSVGLDLAVPSVTASDGILEVSGNLVTDGRLTVDQYAIIGGYANVGGRLKVFDYAEAQGSVYVQSAVNGTRTNLAHTSTDDTWLWNEDGGDVVLWTTAVSGTVQHQLRLNDQGQVLIGPGSPATGFKLSVSGKAIAEEVWIQQVADWPDYVFAPDYERPSLEELDRRISELGRLPGMPSAEAVAEQGVASGEMLRLLLEKVEELTLYTIEQQAEIDALRAALNAVR